MNNTDVPPRWFQFVMDDAKRMARITKAAQDEDYGAMARMLAEFYADPARADRIPRPLLYFHIEQLLCALAHAVGEPLERDTVQ
jgi:hypothetical protein